MKVKFKTRFSLISSGYSSSEKQIFLVCTINNKEFFYYSGYRIAPVNFIKEKIASAGVCIQQVRKNVFNKSGDSAQKINDRLREMEVCARKVFDSNFAYTGDGISEFKMLLQIELGEYKGDDLKSISFFDVYGKYKDESKVSDNRRRHYVADINRLKEYEKAKKHPLTFDNLNIIDYNKYISNGRTSNTVVTIMKRLKGFFSYCMEESIIKENPFDRINFANKIGTEKYDEPVCMTREELTRLYQFPFPDEDNKLARDMFCLQAAFGCRVGDFLRLTYDNIQDLALTYYPSKTNGNKVIVPLSMRAKEIIEKYRGKGKDNLIMPFMNSVHYNEKLKSVFKKAGLDRKIIRYSHETNKEEILILHEIASSHLARRTFVDILCQAGEPIHVVASMSGHSERSKAFDRYRQRPEQLQKDAVVRSMD